MNEEIELRELVIDETSDTGVNYIALVDSPAIQSNWMAFKEQPKEQQFKIENEEKRIVSGYLMKADLPIYRLDENNQPFYVVFRKDTIFDIVLKHQKNGLNSNTNLDHDLNQIAEGVFLFESIIVDSERGQRPPKGFEEAPNGSWWGSMYVDNDEIWQQIKDGTFKGFSVEGAFLQSQPKEVEEDLIEQIIEAFIDYLK